MPSNKNSDKIKELRESLNNVMKKSPTMAQTADVAKTMAERLARRTRLGYGVDVTGGKRKKLEPLSPGRKTQRKRLRKKSQLHNLSTPNRSHLTATGQMLDNLTGISKKSGTGIIKLKNDSRRNVEGSRNMTNSKLIEIHDKLGAGKSKVKRPFYRFSKPEITGLRKLVREILLKGFRSAILKSSK